MKCEEIQLLLDDYLDDLLAATERAALEDHLRGCLTCFRELKELRLLLDSARQLPVAMEPERELWPEILNRIGDRRETTPEARRSRPVAFRSRWLYLAAAALAVAVFSLPLSTWWIERQAGTSPGTATLAGEPAMPIAVVADQARAEDGVVRVRTDLLETLEMRRHRLSPEAAVALEEGMQVVDRALGELHAAIGENPEDLGLRRRLAGKYRMEAKILRRISRA